LAAHAAAPAGHGVMPPELLARSPSKTPTCKEPQGVRMRSFTKLGYGTDKRQAGLNSRTRNNQQLPTRVYSILVEGESYIDGECVLSRPQRIRKYPQYLALPLKPALHGVDDPDQHFFKLRRTGRIVTKRECNPKLDKEFTDIGEADRKNAELVWQIDLPSCLSMARGRSLHGMPRCWHPQVKAERWSQRYNGWRSTTAGSTIGSGARFGRIRVRANLPRFHRDREYFFARAGYVELLPSAKRLRQISLREVLV